MSRQDSLSTGSPAVLLVEDEPQAAQTLADILAAHNYEVSVAATESDALRQAETRGVDIAIVDVHLADNASGLQVMRRLKETVPDLECLVVTGYADLENAIRSLNLGAFGYLRKPIEIPLLLEVLGKALEKQRLARDLRQRLKEVEAAARLNAQVLTERANLMEQLESERRLATALMDAVVGGVAVTDAEGRIVRANGALGVILGLPPDALVGKQAERMCSVESKVQPLLDGTGPARGYLYVFSASKNGNGRAKGSLVSTPG